ncbi:MAG: hypothetical protein Q4G05_00130 [Clostridia bacterium]|nr:hypothetical protein [Clostridia bacterium]
MGAFDTFWSKEHLVKKTIEIDNSLYESLKKLSDKKYDASVNKLINASIMELSKSEDIGVYIKKKNEISVKHSLLIRESLVKELDRLSEKYHTSIYKLVNIAISNALEQIK